MKTMKNYVWVLLLALLAGNGTRSDSGGANSQQGKRSFGIYAGPK